MSRTFVSLLTTAAMLLPLCAAPAPVIAEEQCPALCRNITPMSLTAEHDASDDCDRLSREAGYPCHDRAQPKQPRHAVEPRGPRHRGYSRPVPDSGSYGLY